MKPKFAMFLLLITAVFSDSCKQRESTEASVKGEQAATAQVTPAMSEKERDELYHLSEGADFFPLAWADHVTSMDPAGGKFFEDLDKKHGVLKDSGTGDFAFSGEWVGLSASWINAHPGKPGFDATKADRKAGKKTVEGQTSVVMMGVTCSFCHTGEFVANGKQIRVDGGRNHLNIKGFFKDLGASTLGVYKTPLKLKNFIESIGHNPDFGMVKASKMSAWFLYNVPSAFKKVEKLNAEMKALNWQADEAMQAKVHQAYLDKQAVLKEAFMRLVRATYNIPDDEKIEAIERKMEFCAFLFSGSHPAKNAVDPGFNRTDPIAALTNRTIRGDRPIAAEGNLVWPYLWALKYTYAQHWTAFTNSVVMRNTVQAVGMGAQIYNEFDTDMNLHNIHKIEERIYKAPVPQWTRHFPEIPVNQALAEQGKPIYENQCANCHTVQHNSGPTNKLYNYNLYSADELGTDMTFAQEIVEPVVTKREKNSKGIMIPVESVPFKVAGRNLFPNVVKRYYERWNVSKETQDIWESKSLRGELFLQDTLVDTGKAYVARHLAGIWAAAPFLHNGSVLTIMDLMKKSEQRPKYFKVGHRDFDLKNLGLTVTALDTCKLGDPRCFDTTLPGNSHAGHEYGVDLSDREKAAVLEYLKVLPPLPEYSWQ